VIYIILIFALGLRVIAIDQSLWLDEAISALAVQNHSLTSLVGEYLVGDFSPPLYFVIQWFWVRATGTSELMLRLPSVLYGVGTVYFSYLIAKIYVKSKKSKFAELVALIVAVSPLLVYYSQEARMYSLAALVVTLSIYFFLMHRRSKDVKYFILFFVSFTAALYTHYLTWLMIPVFALWGIRYITPLFTIVPWLPYLSNQLSQGTGAAGNLAVWAELSAINAKNVILVFIKFVSGRIPYLKQSAAVTGLITLSSIVFWVLTLLGAQKIWPGLKKVSKHEYVLVAWLIIPLILAALISIRVPVFSYFRFLFVVPAFILLLAIGIQEISKKYLEVFLGLIVLISLLFSFMYLLNSANHREDWESAVAYLHQSDNDPTVFIRNSVRAPFDYYDKGKSLVLTKVGDVPSEGNLWYFPYAQPIFDPGGQVEKELSEMGFERAKEYTFRQMQLWNYENWN